MEEVWKHLDAISAKLSQYAPVAWQKLVTMTWFESWSDVITDLTLTVLLLVIIGVCTRQFIVANKKFHKAGEEFSEQGPYAVHMLVSGFIGIISILSLLISGIVMQLLDTWVWVGIFSPESRLIHDLLQKVS